VPLSTHFGDDENVAEGRVEQHILSMNSSQCDGAFHSEIGSIEIEYLEISWRKDAHDRSTDLHSVISEANTGPFAAKYESPPWRGTLPRHLFAWSKLNTRQLGDFLVLFLITSPVGLLSRQELRKSLLFRRRMFGGLAK
jgi:hypothetical protein